MVTSKTYLTSKLKKRISRLGLLNPAPSKEHRVKNSSASLPELCLEGNFEPRWQTGMIPTPNDVEGEESPWRPTFLSEKGHPSSQWLPVNEVKTLCTVMHDYKKALVETGQAVVANLLEKQPHTFLELLKRQNAVNVQLLSVLKERQAGGGLVESSNEGGFPEPVCMSPSSPLEFKRSVPSSLDSFDCPQNQNVFTVSPLNLSEEAKVPWVNIEGHKGANRIGGSRRDRSRLRQSKAPHPCNVSLLEDSELFKASMESHGKKQR